MIFGRQRNHDVVSGMPTGPISAPSIRHLAQKSLSVSGCASGTLLLTVVMGLLLPTAAQAVPIHSLDVLPSTAQAGGHPDIAISFSLGNREQTHSACACNDARDIAVHLPTGLIGNPHATPQCTIASFASEECPVDSQLGVTEVKVNDGEPPECENPENCNSAFLSPVYNLIPPPGDAALLGFKTFFSNPVFTVISSRTDSDYGVDATLVNIPHFFPLFASKQVLWGVPSDPVHDDLRWGFREVSIIANAFSLCDANGEPSTDDPSTISAFCPQIGQPEAVGDDTEELVGGPGEPVSSDSPRTPFWQNPTTCGVSSLTTSLGILGYDDSTSEASSPYPATTECDLLTFNPSQSVAPTTTAADSPSGAEFNLTVPQFESPSAPSPSELRAASVTLPPGFSLAPNVTNGKNTCSEAQARFGTTEEATCPEDSKIGTISVETPVLPGPLPGYVYLGEPKPGNRFRLILRRSTASVVHVKLLGTVTPDPQTGQIVISFTELPQTPFSDFNVHIFGSEHGPLDTPTQCGTYEVTTVFTPWDAALPKQTSHQFFEVTEGPNGTPCPECSPPLPPRLPGRLRLQHGRRPHLLLARPHPRRRRTEPQAP